MVPAAMPGLGGVTAIDTSVAEVTVNLVKPEILPKVAVMVVGPADNDEAFPLEPEELLIVATDVEDEVHVTDEVRSCVLLSEKVPVAVSCSAVPRAMDGLVGVTAMETSVFDEEDDDEDEELELPPPPPQLATNATISKRMSVLFIFICKNSFLYIYYQMQP